eukprot:10585204-Heterocapsa_arctica.AAC.1
MTLALKSIFTALWSVSRSSRRREAWPMTRFLARISGELSTATYTALSFTMMGVAWSFSAR